MLTKVIHERSTDRVLVPEDDVTTLDTISESPPERTSMSSRYFALVRQTKKLGDLAMNTLNDVQEVFKKEMSLSRNMSAEDKETSKAKEDTERNIKRLNQLVRHSSEIIASVQTVFPITLFPDSIILDRTKITVTKRNSPWSATTVTVGIDDVLNVSTRLGLFFGSLSIASRVMNSVDHFEITNLWRQDAIELQYLIQGYMITRTNKIDTDHLSVDELAKIVHDLGTQSSN
jgi:hypothetical protein